jgi:hypothetical protein
MKGNTIRVLTGVYPPPMRYLFCVLFPLKNNSFLAEK